MTFRYYTYELLLIFIVHVRCTIDINMAEFQYLANHLHDEECRKLVAALHFDSFDSPNALEEAEKKVSKDVPCLQQLLHWNSEKKGGKTESHELVSRRLRQIGRDDLAKWLTTSSYEALGHEFQRSIRDTVKLYEPIHLPSLYITTDIPQPSTLAKLSSNSWQFTLQRIKKCCESTTRMHNKQNEKARAYGHTAFCQSHSLIHNKQTETAGKCGQKEFCQSHLQIHNKQNEHEHKNCQSHLKMHNKQNKYGHKTLCQSHLQTHSKQNECKHKTFCQSHSKQDECKHKTFCQSHSKFEHKTFCQSHNKQNECEHKTFCQSHNKQNECEHKTFCQPHLNDKQNEGGDNTDSQIEKVIYLSNSPTLDRQNERVKEYGLKAYYHSLLSHIHNKQNEKTRAYGLRTFNQSHFKETFFRQENSPVTITPDELVDLTEWTIFDTISWTIVTLLFLLVIVLLVYLTITSPCWKQRKRRCKCKPAIYDSESSCHCHQRTKCCRSKKKKRSCLCMAPSRRTICACPAMTECPQAVYCTNQTPLPPPKPKSENGYSTGISNSTTYSTVRYM